MQLSTTQDQAPNREKEMLVNFLTKQKISTDCCTCRSKANSEMHLLLLDPTLMCLKQEQATNGGSRTEQPGSGGLLPGVRLLFTNQPEKEKKHRERRGRTSAGSLDLESGGPTTIPHRCALALASTDSGAGCAPADAGQSRRT